MFKFTHIASFTLLLLFGVFSCAQNGEDSGRSANPNQEMADLLAKKKKELDRFQNTFSAEAKIAYCDSILRTARNPEDPALIPLKFKLAEAYLQYGNEEKAIEHFERLLPEASKVDVESRRGLYNSLAVAYLRLGERKNCINNHSSDACILPIQGKGIHQDQYGSRQAIEVFQAILKALPADLDSRWLLNIAYMTLDEYPEKVPPAFLIPGIDAKSEVNIEPFEDIAHILGLNVDNRAGGVVAEDFDNDGYLDIITSAWGLDDPMHYFRNNGDGTFTDRSDASGLSMLTGGLNMVDADYNNDGFVDVFVLRGAWQGQQGFGEQPNSLLKNNGDGTFTDVTISAGVLTFRPSQTATWNDFNKDGWLDLFVGNETTDPGHPYPSEFYINNHDGTFTDAAKAMHIEINRFVKGVTSGDYDNDGWPDIFISTQDGTSKTLLRNKGIQGKIPAFEDVTQKAGITVKGKTFGTWFWDFDNDGWLDIFMANYNFDRALSYYAAREALKPSDDPEGKMYLFRNNRNGTFTDVTRQMNLNKLAFAMGNNFGDIDNDGWLDFFLGTGNPQYQSLVPNKLFKNLGGKKFADVTQASRMGNLQKGHGIAFADLNNDGYQDVYSEMGGAFRGDHFPSSLYLNPGQNDNNWICIKLEGKSSNRSAIGTRVEVKFREHGVQRSLFRDVNSGGSFGCSPFRREIGIGKAAVIDEINISWPLTGKVQTIKNLQPNQFILIKEDQEGYLPVELNVLDFKNGGAIPMCGPGENTSMTQ